MRKKPIKKPAIKKVALHTTLKLLREKSACESGYKKLRESLGAKWPHEKPINLLRVLKSNGVQDMLWCIRATIEPYADFRLHLCGMYADFAESVLPMFEVKFPNDSRPRKAIEATREGAAGAAEAAAGAAEAAAGAAEAAEEKKQAKIIRKYLA